MMQPGHAMIVEAQEDALDPLAAVGEACGQFAIECSDVAGNVNRVAERIRANTVLLSRDRKSVVSGKSVSVRVDIGGRRSINTKNRKHLMRTQKEALNNVIKHPANDQSGTDNKVTNMAIN